MMNPRFHGRGDNVYVQGQGESFGLKGVIAVVKQFYQLPGYQRGIFQNKKSFPFGS
jgi:hypothetical protein